MFQAIDLHVGEVSALGQTMGILHLVPDASMRQRPALSHTVLLVDVSMSMTGSIEVVKEHASKFIAEMDVDEYVSIITFSGHNTATRIVGPTACDKNGKALIEQAISRIHIQNTTVFSEPLAKALTLLEQSGLPGMAHQAVLFTDGCAVPTMWGYQAEETSAFAAAKALGDFGAVVHAIGYGYHYDPVFLEHCIRAAGSDGTFRHISDIEDLSEVIDDIRHTFARLDLSDIKVEVYPSEGAITAFYRVAPEVVQLNNGGGVVQTRSLFDGSLKLYFDATSRFDVARITATINGQTKQLAPDAQPLTPDMQAECIRLKAAYLVLQGGTGDRERAIELLQQTGDEVIADEVAEAYTERDRRSNRDRLRRGFRTKQFFGTGLKPQGPNHCVINVLRALAEDRAVVMSIPAGAYKRGGLLTRDPRIVPSPLGSTVRITGFTSEKERFNFSFVTCKDVKVYRVDDQGAILSDEPPEDRQVYRTYNVIRDGELVLPKFYASMSEATFDQLQAAGVIDDEATYRKDKSYLLDLSHLKMVSSAWARPASLQLGRLMCEIRELEEEQKTLNASIKARMPVRDIDEVVSDTGGKLYREQAKAVQDDDTVIEYYIVPLVELRLMKYKVLYKPNTGGQTVDELVARAKEVRQQLRTLRWRARLIVYACHLTGWKSITWGAPKKAAQSDKQERLASIPNAQLKLVTGEKEVAAS